MLAKQIDKVFLDSNSNAINVQVIERYYIEAISILPLIKSQTLGACP
jgi:hypothetical protein